MPILNFLQRQPRYRHYALLDGDHHCRMLLTAAERPTGERWREIPEIRPEWIGRKLPDDYSQSAR